LNIALIGPGLVGKEFLAQLSKFQNDKVTLSLIALLSSTKMKLSTNLEFTTTLDDGLPISMPEFMNHIKKENTVVVDCTSNEQIALLYPEILKTCHLITPNKKGYSGDINLFNQIVSQSKKHQKFHKHESTVGAGLPIIQTLKDLVQTGDEIVKIEGIFSGTLSYIFNSFSSRESTLKFSEIVSQAKNLGYTEPDPRDDLNGMDVARKVVILSRDAGMQISLNDLNIENIVPENLRALDSIEFMKNLGSADEYFESLNKKALAKGCVLRYVGVIDPKGKCSVGLGEYLLSHPFASLKGSDNVIAFTTKRFPNPLIVQGAGAGSAVTAFGMFSDLLKIAAYVGGPL
jgi:homoserine dehydrogenase